MEPVGADNTLLCRASEENWRSAPLGIDHFSKFFGFESPALHRSDGRVCHIILIIGNA